jgi:hypothetical protein
LLDDFAAFPPEGGCEQLCGWEIARFWAVGFAATNKKKHIKTKLAISTTELHCPQGVFFFIFQKNISRENLASFPQKLAKLRYPKVSFLII